MSDSESFATLEEVTSKRWDYIVCGGGTAGLTLAARLSEDPSNFVLVLDAGSANLNDPTILVPAQYMRQIFQDQYDWKFFTIPQQNAGGRPFLWPRGKSLGGSSAMNFMIYMRPCAEDINVWEELGNPGWNWENHIKYIKRGEKFTPPTAQQTEVFKQTYEPEAHGFDGTLHIGYPKLIMDGEVPFQQTLNNAGIPTIKEAMVGDTNGTWMAATTIEPGTLTRSYSATAFWLPYKDRPNYRVLLQASVDKVVFSSAGENGLYTAEGVQITYAGKPYVIKAAKEVVICTGGIKSPQLLELSGIGESEILKPLGIEPLITLPGVGNNVQEHLFYGITFELNGKEGGWNTLDKLMTQPEYAEAQMKLFGDGQGMHTLALSSIAFAPLQKTSPIAEELIARLCRRLDEERKEGKISDALWEQYEIQLRHLKSDKSVDAEFIVLPYYMPRAVPPEEGKEYMTILICLNRPFSRGTIHIASADPQQPPICDPKYFDYEFDMQILVEGLRFVRSLTNVEPFKSMIVREAAPGSELQTYEDLRAWIVSELSTTFHTAGACAMRPREKEGVLDPKLKVYGTTNVRVADMSILPLHIASHPMSSVYGIGEQAADIILGKA